MPRSQNTNVALREFDSLHPDVANERSHLETDHLLPEGRGERSRNPSEGDGHIEVRPLTGSHFAVGEK